MSRCLALALTFVVTLSLLHCNASDWPYRRGLLLNGFSLETDWKHEWPGGTPPRVWKASVGTGFSSVVVANQRAYTLGNSNGVETVYCLDADTGGVQWTYSYAEPINPKMYEGGPNSTPTVHQGKLYTASRTGLLLCFEAATGSVTWSNQIAGYVGRTNGTWGLAGSPAFDGPRLLINYGSALVALDAHTGKTLWKSAEDEKGDFSFTTPVVTTVDGKSTVLAHMNKALFAVDSESGKVLWRHEFGRGYETHCSDPVLTPLGVFISSGDDGGELLQFNRSSAKRIWKNKNLGTFTGTAVVKDGFLYGVDSGAYKKGQQTLRCVELATGEVKWSAPDMSQDGWIAAGDRLLLLTERGELVVARLNGPKSEILARTQLMGGKCWPQPTLAEGKLYGRNAKGEVACFDLR